MKKIPNEYYLFFLECVIFIWILAFMVYCGNV